MTPPIDEIAGLALPAGTNNMKSAMIISSLCCERGAARVPPCSKPVVRAPCVRYGLDASSVCPSSQGFFVGPRLNPSFFSFFFLDGFPVKGLVAPNGFS